MDNLGLVAAWALDVGTQGLANSSAALLSAKISISISIYI